MFRPHSPSSRPVPEGRSGATLNAKPKQNKLPPQPQQPPSHHREQYYKVLELPAASRLHLLGFLCEQHEENHPE